MDIEQHDGCRNHGGHLLLVGSFQGPDEEVVSAFNAGETTATAMGRARRETSSPNNLLLQWASHSWLKQCIGIVEHDSNKFPHLTVKRLYFSCGTTGMQAEGLLWRLHACIQNRSRPPCTTSTTWKTFHDFRRGLEATIATNVVCCDKMLRQPLSHVRERSTRKHEQISSELCQAVIRHHPHPISHQQITQHQPTRSSPHRRRPSSR